MSKQSPDDSQGAFEQIFCLLPFPAAVITGSGSIRCANNAFAAAVGSPRDTLRSKSLHHYCDLLPPELDKLVGAACPVQLRAPGGPELFQLSLQVLADKELLAIFMRQTAATLQQHKLESLGVLAGSVAHDLSNILTSVLGHISFLRLSALQPEGAPRRMDESLLAVEDGARRAASITQKILDFTRGQETSFCSVRLAEVAESAVKLFRPSIPAGISLELSVVDPDVCVLGDDHQLGQVLMNLMVNARDALPSGGKVTIQVDSLDVSAQGQSGEFRLDPGSYGIIRIADTGPGIPEEVRQRIFEPFFTTKSHSGTGLGLAIVSSIVKVHQALIAVESDPASGTVFSLFFPRCFGAAGEISRELPEDEDVPRGTEQILVVDDEEAVRVIVQRSLEHLGYRVTVARNGAEAIRSFAENPRAFQLVIIDMIMPNMAGDELFQELQQIDRLVPVLIASGYSSDARTRNILEHGGLGFIQKPFAVEELAREVRRCLDAAQSRRPASPAAPRLSI